MRFNAASEEGLSLLLWAPTSTMGMFVSIIKDRAA